MDNQTDIDILFQRRQDILQQDLIGICNRAGLPRERVAALMKSINALCGLYLLQQLQKSQMLSEDTISKFIHQA